ncbi:DUF4190 domain-containing protein [Streptomyces sp. NBC_00555]|uniref:DUF4190 domain-containing protein n=1 Tax=Streptomyces sp. NBC_00555 TaxID=2903662 RepID=UPI00225786D5|nr:DUF4190 domain-containing protein [Streptomyces sp. NBC_00555]MCX5011939.1 DUF4190 domain-containing protein [Streptomyces sp. NBC_00555]
MSTPPSPPSGPGHSWPPPSPQPGWGPPPGYGQPHPEQALNGFALASLLVGLLCLPPLGIVFGIVALVQIARRRQRGRALAIVGLAVSVVMTGVMVLTVDRVATAVRDRMGAMGEFADVEGDLRDLDDLRAGDCFNVPGGDLLDDRPLTYKVDCAQTHHGEVTASKLLDLDPESVPESAEADRASEDECWKAQDAYAMDTWALPAYAEMFYFAPSRQSWRQGDRRLVCVIGTTEEERRGSLRQDAGSLKPEQSAFLRVANEVEFVLGRPPEGDLEDTLPEHQAWARTVYSALGDEAKVLEADKARPGLEKAVQAQLKEIEAARTAWQRTSQAKTVADFDRQWERALGTMSVETEKALRGAYGLSTEVPEWLLESPESPEGGSGRGPSSQPA